MCSISIVSFYYLSSSLSSGLGAHCSTFLSRIHPLSMPWERSCDGFWLKVAYTGAPSRWFPFIMSPSFPPTLLSVRFTFSVLFPSFLSFRVQYQRFSPCFQFYHSRICYSMFSVPIPCRLHFQSFVYSLFPFVSVATSL